MPSTEENKLLAVNKLRSFEYAVMVKCTKLYKRRAQNVIILYNVSNYSLITGILKVDLLCRFHWPLN